MELIQQDTTFKQSEVGLIPQDWIVYSLSDCCTKITDGTHDTPRPIQSGRPFLTAIHVKENNIDFDNCYYLPDEVHRTIYKRCNPQKGDVLMVNIGAGVATTALVNVDYEFSLKNVALIKPDPKKVLGSYLNFWQTREKQKIVNSISTGGAQPFLSLNQIASLRIALPNKLEQGFIAKALSDMDALIRQTEKLIEKKKAIKQGAMQELLTPKANWFKKKLGEVAQIYTGKKNNQDKVEDGAYPFFVRSQTIERIDSYSFDGEAVLVPGEGNIGNIFHYINGRFDFHQRVYKISDFAEGFLGRYIFLYMQQHFGLHALANTVKATVDSLRLPTFLEFEISFPDNQLYVADTLFAMSEEIHALESKLSKLTLQKQGMMQALLTGKIRLV